jgi:hypothetical protein
MREFSKVSPVIWRSARFQGLRADDGKLLIFYLMTCAHNNSAGCFWLPDGYACHDLGWEQDRYDAAMRLLIDAEMVDHDAENQIVLIERWFRHNPSMNKSHYKGILSQLEKIPSDRLQAKAFASLEAAENATGKPKTNNGTQPPDKSDARPAPSDGVTSAHLKTPYMTGKHRR